MIASDLELGFSPQNPKSRTTYRYPALNQTQKLGLTKIWTNKASRIWWNPPNLVNPITKCNWLNQGNVLNTSRHKGNWCHLNLSSCHIEVEAETWMLQTWSRLPYILHYNIIRIVNAFCNIRLYLDHTSKSKSPWFHSHCTFNSCIACPIYPWVRGVHSWAVWSLQRSYKPGVSFCLWSSILVQECPLCTNLTGLNLSSLKTTYKFLWQWLACTQQKYELVLTFLQRYNYLMYISFFPNISQTGSLQIPRTTKHNIECTK